MIKRIDRQLEFIKEDRINKQIITIVKRQIDIWLEMLRLIVKIHKGWIERSIDITEEKDRKDRQILKLLNDGQKK